MRSRQCQAAQQLCGGRRTAAQPVTVRLEQCNERGDVGTIKPLVACRGQGGGLRDTSDRHQLPDTGQAVLQNADALGEAAFERSVGVDRGELPGNLRGIVGSIDRGLNQRLDVGKCTEDRSLGDTCGLGDLSGRDAWTVLEQQRKRRRDDRSPPLGRRHGCGATLAHDVALDRRVIEILARHLARLHE